MAKKAGRPSTRTLLLGAVGLVVAYVLYRRYAANSSSGTTGNQPVPSYFYPTPGNAPSSNAQPVSYGGGTASQPATGGTGTGSTGGYVPYQTYTVGGKAIIGGGRRT